MFKTMIEISGMECSMCEAHINDCIRQNLEVKSVKSSHKKRICEIVSYEPLNEDTVKALLEKLGYSIVSFKYESFSKKRLFKR